MKILRVKDFNLEATLDSGQVFGFEKSAGKVYAGRVFDRPLRLWQKADRLFADGPPGGTAEDLKKYFDLDRDLTRIFGILKSDAALEPALRKFRGLRLIRQDAWEALACFIISSNNNVKRIQGIWKNLSRHFAERPPKSTADHRPAALFGGMPRFPLPGQIAGSHERILRSLGLGYRAPFLSRTAEFVSNNPACLEHIRRAPYAEARQRIIAFPGIGPKVADCALLYGFQKYEAFPVDVWILRAMRKLYFKNRRVTEEKVHAFGQKRWGSNAGYVQQYLFHGAKNGVL